MREKFRLKEHQKTAAHHVYVGFAAGVIVTAGLALIAFAVLNGIKECESVNSVPELSGASTPHSF